MIKENVLTTCINFLKNQLTESFLKPINKLGNLQKHGIIENYLYQCLIFFTRQPQIKFAPPFIHFNQAKENNILSILQAFIQSYKEF